jgi:hypothetical protein
MSKKKLLIPLVLLLVLGVGYTMTKPKKTVKQKIPGTIYLMPQPGRAGARAGTERWGIRRGLLQLGGRRGDAARGTGGT